ncbi:MAG: hypothetical protein IJ242_07765, partial [Clostridia bacterium]|nr:hypothetical protein [Clostridia bacterium]
LVSGRQSSSCWYGIYHNLMWEDYQLCIHPNCPQCIAVTFGDDSVFVFNGPNEDETAAYFEALYNQIKSVAR